MSGDESEPGAPGGRSEAPTSDIQVVLEHEEPSLIPYVTAGDPDLESTAEYVEALARGGADVIELGLPFSEPIAEGPTIQAAIRRALEAGTTPGRFFDLVADLDVEPPLVVMTYYNLVYQYGSREALRASERSSGQGPRDAVGPEPFVAAAAEAGLSGIIVPDLPVEESDPLADACEEHGLDLIFIVAPTTRGDRLDSIVERVSGFLYVQARLGTTGARGDVSQATHESLARLADYEVPKAVGFGVSEPEHATEIVEAGADGVIVGSALVDIVADGTDVATRLERKVATLKRGAVDGFTQGEPRTKHT